MSLEEIQQQFMAAERWKKDGPAARVAKPAGAPPSEPGGSPPPQQPGGSAEGSAEAEPSAPKKRVAKSFKHSRMKQREAASGSQGAAAAVPSAVPQPAQPPMQRDVVTPMVVTEVKERTVGSFAAPTMPTMPTKSSHAFGFPKARHRSETKIDVGRRRRAPATQPRAAPAKEAAAPSNETEKLLSEVSHENVVQVGAMSGPEIEAALAVGETVILLTLSLHPY